jgi:hypothetical protein
MLFGWLGTSKKTVIFRFPHFGHLSRSWSISRGISVPRVQTRLLMSAPSGQTVEAIGEKRRGPDDRGPSGPASRRILEGMVPTKDHSIADSRPGKGNDQPAQPLPSERPASMLETVKQC